MKNLLAAVLLSISACASGSIAHAGTLIPYPTPGTVNAESYSFTATAAGSIVAYFFGGDATDTDEIAVSVNGGPLSAFGLNNQSTSVGSTFDFGGLTVAAGDTLTFVLRNLTKGTDISSDPAANSDGTQHVYSAAFTSNGTIPDGTYVAFEDLLAGLGSDFDYNDVQFVFTNVSPNAVPLPAALPLFASGLGVVGFLGWRRKRKAQAAVA